MSKEAKVLVSDFYAANVKDYHTIMETYLHPDVVLIWNSASSGLSILHYQELSNFFNETSRTYSDLRNEVSHVLCEDNHVTIRYKSYVRTIENPDEELGIAHFISIWEVKDGKLYRGYSISQPVTDNDDTQESYHRVKV